MMASRGWSIRCYETNDIVVVGLLFEDLISFCEYRPGLSNVPTAQEENEPRAEYQNNAGAYKNEI